jgi:hypothetical protein
MHNETHGWLGDLLDAWHENTHQGGNTYQFWELVHGLKYEQEHQEIVQRSVYEQASVGRWSEPDYNYMRLKVGSSLANGKKVVIVAHSQGNFFYNKLHSDVRNDGSEHLDCLAGVGIATPLSHYPGEYTHTTSTNDDVMTLVRLAYGGLQPNIVIPEDFGGDSRGHELVRTYLNYSSSNSRIVDDIDAAVAQLEMSCASDFTIDAGVEQGPDPMRPSVRVTNTDGETLEGRLHISIEDATGGHGAYHDLGVVKIYSGQSYLTQSLSGFSEGRNHVRVWFAQNDGAGLTIASKDITYDLGMTACAGPLFMNSSGLYFDSEDLNLGTYSGRVNYHYMTYNECIVNPFLSNPPTTECPVFSLRIEKKQDGSNVVYREMESYLHYHSIVGSFDYDPATFGSSMLDITARATTNDHVSSVYVSCPGGRNVRYDAHPVILEHRIDEAPTRYACRPEVELANGSIIPLSGKTDIGSLTPGLHHFKLTENCYCASSPCWGDLPTSISVETDVSSDSITNPASAGAIFIGYDGGVEFLEY